MNTTVNKKDRFTETVVFNHLIPLDKLGNKISSYSKSSFIEAIKEYSDRTKYMDTFLGISTYDINEDTDITSIRTSLLEHTSVGIIRSIEAESETLAADCIYNYDADECVIGMFCETEQDNDGTTSITDVYRCHIMRKYQKGVSIIDGSSVIEYINKIYPFEYKLPLIGYISNGKTDKSEFKILLDEFKNKIGYRFGESARVIIDYKSRISFGVVTSIDSCPDYSSYPIVTFRTKKSLQNLNCSDFSNYELIALVDSQYIIHLIFESKDRKTNLIDIRHIVEKERADTENDKELEFSDEQIKRIDEIENAVFDLCKVMTQNLELDWNMSFIGEIADAATEILCRHGHRIWYPACVYDNDEEPKKIVEYCEPTNIENNCSIKKE